MPLLKNNPFEEDIDKATCETNTEENWAAIMNICDNASTSNGAKLCIAAIKRYLRDPVPLVVLRTFTVIDSCVNNCGTTFKLELSSKDFVNELKNLATKGSHYKIMDKSKELIKKWAHMFKDEPAFFQIPALYHQLLKDGFVFPTLDSGSNIKSTSSLKTSDPNFVESKEEEEDIAKAIQLSLNENNKYTAPRQAHLVKPDNLDKNFHNEPPLYADLNTMNGSASAGCKNGSKSLITATAIYDFEAVEDNEISFKIGDNLVITDDSDINWWKGRVVGSAKEGLFPATFVTLNRLDNDNLRRPISDVTTQSMCNGGGHHEEIFHETYKPSIDKETLDNCLRHLHQADPMGKIPDSHELYETESRSLGMSTLIDQELEKVDDCHAKLCDLNRKLNEAFRFYNYLLSSSAGHQQLINQPPQLAGTSLSQQPTYPVPNVQQLQQQNFSQQSYLQNTNLPYANNQSTMLVQAPGHQVPQNYDPTFGSVINNFPTMTAPQEQMYRFPAQALTPLTSENYFETAQHPNYVSQNFSAPTNNYPGPGYPLANYAYNNLSTNSEQLEMNNQNLPYQQQNEAQILKNSTISQFDEISNLAPFNIQSTSGNMRP